MTNFAFIIFLSIRWCNMKKHLFRYYRKPRTYNEDLSDEFMFWVPFAGNIVFALFRDAMIDSFFAHPHTHLR